MKLVLVIACCFAVVLAAPRPDQQEDERQQQLRRRLQGLRLRLADVEPITKHEQRNERYFDREEDVLRKIAQRGNQALAVYPRGHQPQQPYHDLGSLNFRYYAPSQPFAVPVPISPARGRHEENQAYRQNYYREAYLREQDQDREDDDDDDQD